MAQPRNLLGGHILSALVGVALRELLLERAGAPEWLGASLAVALSITVMMATSTLHPPGAATALIAVTGDTALRSLGFLYVLMPVAAGAAILLGVALVMNNVCTRDRPGLELAWPHKWH